MTNLQYLYTYTFHHDEDELCYMEMRAFFERDTRDSVIISPVKIDPSRSPFMNMRLTIEEQAPTLEALIAQLGTLHMGDETFRVTCFNNEAYGETAKIDHPTRRKIERTVAMSIQGEPELDNPAVEFGLVQYGDMWYFGRYELSESVWRHHLQKPHMYSTALSTRVARAIANIAVPFPEGVKAIDPCCGIGTVLVEARSMGIDIVGRDMNQLVVYGSRKNLRHFGYHDQVDIGPIAEATGEFDVAIIDMPYNLFTKITREQQGDILKEARRITKHIVIVTIEPMDDLIEAAGFSVVDRCFAKKSNFSREILYCQ